MRETDIFRYYAFGFNYYLLRYTKSGIAIHEILRQRIEDFFSFLDELDLQVTKQAGGVLEEIAEELRELPGNATVDEALAKRVRETVERFDAALDAELQLRSAYIVTPKRFDLTRLLKKPDGLFATSVFKKLPLICQYDFASACKCIAFELPTAAAFHIMRGTEGVLRYYYRSIVIRGRVKRFLWHEMLEHLKKRKDGPPKPVVDHLDNIRLNFRNPTQHPEARHDMDGAQDLLSISIDVVNRMIKDMAKRSEADAL
ncbi:MAG: hypothetical protein KAV87_50085 [Desulfobacteraceae bacterium]|nr:hypothetical protein [Desulfobacteraceae bacterium]